MRVLVTGAAGFIGGYVATHLAATGHEVAGAYRSHLKARPSVRMIHDLVIPDGPFDAIVHCAATHPVSGASLEKTIRDNVPPMLALVEMARVWNVKAFILLSSISVYGKITDPVVEESTPRISPDVYGSTKYLCECALMEQPFPSLSLRLPGVIGPGAYRRNWLPGVAAHLLAGDTINAYNLDKPFNAVAHVADIAEFIDDVLPKLADSPKKYEALVLGAGSAMKVREVIEILAESMGNMEVNWSSATMSRWPFTLSSQRAILGWGYDPMKIGTMVSRYAVEFMADENRA
jgi:nucleoside-diphosphate-sugar epimerase